MTSALIFPGTITDPQFGKFHSYEGTYDSTIFLWDAEYAPLSSIPAVSSTPTTVTNLVRGRAAEVSSLSVSSCDFELLNTGTDHEAEITGQGGIHVASTQAGGQAAASALAFRMPAAFGDWLLTQTDAGADYAVMFQVWMQITRPGITNVAIQAPLAFTSGSGATSNYLLHASGGTPTGAGSVLPSNGQALNVLGVAGTRGVLAVASDQWTGTKPGSMGEFEQRQMASVGAYGAWDSFNFNKGYSAIIYRVQVDLVDLSDIAGATVAAKAAGLLAEHNTMFARDFAVGGRFYNDTFTAAATLKP